MRHFVGGRLSGLALGALLAVTGCSTTEEAEPDVSSIRVTVGTQTITISSNGTVTGGPITITRPTAPALSASFLKADGTQDAIAHGSDFELNAVSASATLLTFTRTSGFAGTLTGLAAGSTQLAVSLRHIADGDAHFGPFNVPVTVN